MSAFAKLKFKSYIFSKQLNSYKAMGCIIILFWLYCIMINIDIIYTMGASLPAIGGILFLILSFFGVRTGILIIAEKRRCAFSILFLSSALTVLSALTFLTSRDYFSQMWPVWVVTFCVIVIHWVSLRHNIKIFKD